MQEIRSSNFMSAIIVSNFRNSEFMTYCNGYLIL